MYLREIISEDVYSTAVREEHCSCLKQSVHKISEGNEGEHSG
jgi:hypothetical protein